MTLFSRLVLVTALFLFPTVGITQQETPPDDTLDMAQIEQAWARGDFESARNGLEILATETGTAMAQYRYGRILLEGRGGPQDIDAAVTWLQKAVDQNNADAAILLARIYLNAFDEDAPIETRRSPERAADLLTLAATLGFAEGQFRLAQLYLSGQGVERDDKAAFRWLLAAAQQGHVNAQFPLAEMYSRGVGTNEDDTQALHWLTTAANNGNLESMMALARAFEAGSGVEQSPQQAMDFYRRLADAGVPLAQRHLGTGLLFGDAGVSQNSEEGLRWLQGAAKAGDPEAMAILGQAYLVGKGVPQDDTQAAYWYVRAAQYNHGHAKIAYGAMQETGQGTAKNFDAALALYRQALDIPDGNTAAVRLGQLASSGALDGRFAPQRMVPWVLAALQANTPRAEIWLLDQADAGLRTAQSGLATLYLAGSDKTAQGVDMLKRAALGGDAAAQMRLGKMYMIGDHVELDYVAAHQWLNIAATQGQTAATGLRTTVTTLMTPDQVADAQALARNWFATGQPLPPAPTQAVTDAPKNATTPKVRN